MKNINKLVYLLLFCLLLQNNMGIIDFLKSLSDSQNHLSLFLKDFNKAPVEEEENEKESKESENKENENKENENKEKEKELKSIKYIPAFVFLSVSGTSDLFRKTEDAKLFSLNTDTETPPPKTILAV